MHFFAVEETNKGKYKRVNQDSIILRHARLGSSEIMLCVVCDGVGGLSRGEEASGYMTDVFSSWYEKELPDLLLKNKLSRIGHEMGELVKRENKKLYKYGQQKGFSLGTTLTAVLLYENEYAIAHVGDSRVYFLGREISQLTKDHTLEAKGIKSLSSENAVFDTRSVLWQCVGAERNVEPQLLSGSFEKGYFILCSDGFRNRCKKEEIETMIKGRSRKKLSVRIRDFIKLMRIRGETDDISVIVVKAEEAYE